MKVKHYESNISTKLVEGAQTYGIERYYHYIKIDKPIDKITDQDLDNYKEEFEMILNQENMPKIDYDFGAIILTDKCEVAEHEYEVNSFVELEINMKKISCDRENKMCNIICVDRINYTSETESFKISNKQCTLMIANKLNENKSYITIVKIIK